MSKTITTKYGTKINVDGLTPEQIAKVRSVAEDKGAYGAKGATLADQLRKSNGKTTTPVNTPAPTDTGTTGTGNTFKDADSYLDSIITNMKPLDLSGAPKVLTADDLASQRQSTYDALYRQNTAHMDQNKARDMEAQKQELANRGIPINFASDPNNKDNLYARSIGDVNNRYDTLNQQAQDAATTGADARMATEASVNKTAADTFLQGAQAKFQSQLDSMSTSGSIIQDLMTKYGIDADTAKAKLAAKTSTKIAQLNNQKSGGGSSSSSGSGFQIGGEAP